MSNPATSAPVSVDPSGLDAAEFPANDATLVVGSLAPAEALTPEEQAGLDRIAARNSAALESLTRRLAAG